MYEYVASIVTQEIWFQSCETFALICTILLEVLRKIVNANLRNFLKNNIVSNLYLYAIILHQHNLSLIHRSNIGVQRLSKTMHHARDLCGWSSPINHSSRETKWEFCTCEDVHYLFVGESVNYSIKSLDRHGGGS
jgi:hypothetical protein